MKKYVFAGLIGFIGGILIAPNKGKKSRLKAIKAYNYIKAMTNGNRILIKKRK